MDAGNPSAQRMADDPRTHRGHGHPPATQPTARNRPQRTRHTMFALPRQKTHRARDRGDSRRRMAPIHRHQRPRPIRTHVRRIGRVRDRENRARRQPHRRAPHHRQHRFVGRKKRGDLRLENRRQQHPRRCAPPRTQPTIQSAGQPLRHRHEPHTPRTNILHLLPAPQPAQPGRRMDLRNPIRPTPRPMGTRQGTPHPHPIRQHPRRIRAKHRGTVGERVPQESRTLLPLPGRGAT